MMQTVRKVQWAKGVELVWRKDDRTGVQDIGIETDAHAEIVKG
jgi:hypothetical protein